jgi:hypothetical protein
VRFPLGFVHRADDVGATVAVSQWSRHSQVASTGVADSHGWKTQSHALVQHADVVIESIVRGGLGLELVTRPEKGQL